MAKIAQLLFLVMFMAGCSTTLVRESPREIVMGETGVKCATTSLVKALMTKRGVVVQAISGHWKSRVFTAECVLKGEDACFTAIFLAPHMRLATLKLTPPHTIAFERAREIPSAFEPEYLLFDLAVVNLPLDVLRGALGGRFRVEENRLGRRVYLGSREVASLVREDDGRMTYENRMYDYGYSVKEVK